jgi:hypothetical protein
MRGFLVTIVLATGVVAAAPVPSGAATLHAAPVKREIARQMAATYPGLTFGNVACPDGVTRRADVTFTCTVQLPGAFVFVDVTQTDGRGQVGFENVQAVLDRKQLEAFVAGNASLPASVSCGTTAWIIVRPGRVVTCHAAIADGSQRDVQVTVRDTSGNVTITGVT